MEMTATEQLLKHWQAQRLPISAGVTESELTRFESDYALRLPEDLREYFVRLNGMVQRGGCDVDQEGFAFWPLERFRPLPVVCVESGVTVPIIEGPESYFVFADYFQWSWAYAIRLGTAWENAVVLVGAEKVEVVGSSFTEFVRHYVVDSAVLYPGRSEQVA